MDCSCKLHSSGSEKTQSGSRRYFRLGETEKKHAKTFNRSSHVVEVKVYYIFVFVQFEYHTYSNWPRSSCSSNLNFHSTYGNLWFVSCVCVLVRVRATIWTLVSHSRNTNYRIRWFVNGLIKPLSPTTTTITTFVCLLFLFIFCFVDVTGAKFAISYNNGYDHDGIQSNFTNMRLHPCSVLCGIMMDNDVMIKQLPSIIM